MRKAGSRFSDSIRIASALALAFAATLAFSAAPASAELAHTTVTGEYGKLGPPASGIEGGCYIAYQTAEHKLYFMGGGKIYGLNRTGVGTVTPIEGSFPISVTRGECGDPHFTVSQANGNIYQVASTSEIFGYSSAGASLAGFPVSLGSGETCGVASTSTGEAWGGNYQQNSVLKFSSSGASTGSVSIGYSLCKIAVDPVSNDLYVSNYSSTVTQYTASSGYSAGLTFQGPGSPGMVINGTRHTLYMPNGSEVIAYDTTTGDVRERIHFGGYTYGVAVDESNDTLFIADETSGTIKEIPAAVVPKATTGEPVGNTKVSGVADPDGGGNVTKCFFEYGTATENYDLGEKPCDQATPYASSTPVTATLEGLSGETEYHYRLVACNDNVGGCNFGADRTVTPHNVKGLATEAATEIGRSSAQLNGSFEGNGELTEYRFQWGVNGYEFESPWTSAGSPTYPPRTFRSHTPTNLHPDTTYHFRVVAKNGLGFSPASDRTFTTLPAVQNLATEAASAVGKKTATLHASFDGDGTPTTWSFKWGKTASYGNETTIEGSSSAAHVGISVTLDQLCASSPTPCPNLEVDQDYHFRIVATNGLGTSEGADLTLHTQPAVSSLATKPATSIGQDSITLNGEYVGEGEPTHFYFEYGLTTSYGKVTPAPPGTDAGAGSGPQKVETKITDFEGYETYHYRVVAINGFGTSYGQDETFVAPAAPLPEVRETSASGIGPTAATLSAQINPNRWMTVYAFEYGPTTQYGSTTEISKSVGADQAMHPVSATVTGLAPGTLYHFRAIAINFTGTTYGPDLTLITPDAPRIETASASNVGTGTAHLSGTASPNSAATVAHFEFGKTAAYGSSTADVPIGSDAGLHQAAADLGGLEPSTTYHYRLVATNQYGITRGPDGTFSTVAAKEQAAGGTAPLKCKKGFVKRRGHCVKKKHPKKRHGNKRSGETR